MIKFKFHFSFHLCWGKKDFKSNLMETAVKGGIPESRNPTVKECCHQLIMELSACRGKSTLDNYGTALRSFLRYAGEEVRVSDIHPSMLEGYQRWLLDNGLTLNTVSCYMRSLKSLFVQVTPHRQTDGLFKRVYTGNAPTEKRSISIDDLQRLRRLPLKSGSQLRLARDLFMFSVCCMGMPFVDIAFLRKSQLKDGYITYQRHKTGQHIRVRIEEYAQQIIKQYSRTDSSFVFPILQQGTMHEYQMMLSRYNRQLRRLESLAGLGHHLTSYVARHSWASIAYQENIELSVISKALGHTSTKNTLIYLREIDDQRVDDANQGLVRLLTEKE